MTGMLVVGEPKSRISKKTLTLAPERYTAEFLYTECLNIGCEKPLYIAMRHELHFAENMHLAL